MCRVDGSDFLLSYSVQKYKLADLLIFTVYVIREIEKPFRLICIETNPVLLSIFMT